MGSGEKALLTCLAVCALGVGGLSLHSAALTRPERSADNTSSTETIAAPSSPVAVLAQQFSDHVSAETFTSARPAPSRDNQAILRRIELAGPRTYLGHMLQQGDSSLSRWTDRRSDRIRIWVQDGGQVDGWRSNLQLVARDAFRAWSSPEIPAVFQLVADSAVAEIVVVWTTRFSDSRVGATRRYRDQHGWLARAEITLALSTSGGSVMSDEYVRAVAIHEVGHALGLDHSPDNADVMAERNHGVVEPSTRDRATLALLYEVPPGSVAGR